MELKIVCWEAICLQHTILMFMAMGRKFQYIGTRTFNKILLKAKKFTKSLDWDLTGSDTGCPIKQYQIKFVWVVLSKLSSHILFIQYNQDRI